MITNNCFRYGFGVVAMAAIYCFIHHQYFFGVMHTGMANKQIQQYTHKLQHPNIATYSEITTFSRNQTKLQVFFKLQLLRSYNILLSTDVL